jgi:hypothetical protein
MNECRSSDGVVSQSVRQLLEAYPGGQWPLNGGRIFQRLLASVSLIIPLTDYEMRKKLGDSPIDKEGSMVAVAKLIHGIPAGAEERERGGGERAERKWREGARGTNG